MAERKRFELSNRVSSYTLSKRAPSATRPPLRNRNFKLESNSKNNNKIYLKCYKYLKSLTIWTMTATILTAVATSKQELCLQDHETVFVKIILISSR